MTKPRKQIVLGAYLGGVNHQTVWDDPAAGSQIAFSSFKHVAQTAERGKFDLPPASPRELDRCPSSSPVRPASWPVSWRY